MSTKNENTSGQNNSSSGESAIIQTSQTQGTNPSMIQRTFRDNGQHTRSLTEGVERRLVFNDDNDD